MKELKNKSTKVMANALAASVLLTSCSQGGDFDYYLPQESSTSDCPETNGVPISLTLTEETRTALLQLEPLVQEIIENPSTAHEFAANPKLFCEKRNFPFSIDENDAVFKIILALGDNDINAAITASDFELFMQLCESKGLLDERQVSNINVVFQSEEEQQIFESIALQLNGKSIETRSVAMVVVVSVVVALAIVITLTVGYPEQNDDRIACADNFSFMHNIGENKAVLDIWALKNKDYKDYNVVGQYQSYFANSIVSYLKKYRPNIFDNYSESQIQEFLKRNMIV